MLYACINFIQELKLIETFFGQGTDILKMFSCIAARQFELRFELAFLWILHKL